MQQRRAMPGFAAPRMKHESGPGAPRHQGAVPLDAAWGARDRPPSCLRNRRPWCTGSPTHARHALATPVPFETPLPSRFQTKFACAVCVRGWWGRAGLGGGRAGGRGRVGQTNGESRHSDHMVGATQVETAGPLRTKGACRHTQPRMATQTHMRASSRAHPAPPGENAQRARATHAHTLTPAPAVTAGSRTGTAGTRPPHRGAGAARSTAANPLVIYMQAGAHLFLRLFGGRQDALGGRGSLGAAAQHGGGAGKSPPKSSGHDRPRALCALLLL
jgi:hypothetical protein